MASPKKLKACMTECVSTGQEDAHPKSDGSHALATELACVLVTEARTNVVSNKPLFGYMFSFPVKCLIPHSSRLRLLLLALSCFALQQFYLLPAICGFKRLACGKHLVLNLTLSGGMTAMFFFLFIGSSALSCLRFVILRHCCLHRRECQERTL